MKTVRFITKKLQRHKKIMAATRGSRRGAYEYTDVRVRKISKEGKMKAVVSVTIDDEFVVHDIKVIEGDKGLFIAMPSRRSSDGEYRDVAHPINTSTRERLQAVILEAYEKAEESPEE